MEIGLGADDDAGSEGGGVRAVLGMKDQVSVDERRGVGTRLLALQHPEEVGGMPEVRIGRNGFASIADMLVGRDDDRHLGNEPDPFAQRRSRERSSASGSKAE